MKARSRPGAVAADEIAAAEATVEAWRQWHAPVLSSVGANLRYYVAPFGDPHVTQRLKRLRTIVDKLRRESTRLSQMEDVGGVRAVVSRPDDVFAVVRQLRRNWTVTRERDYMAHPKPDGYRAVHLTVRRRGRLIEVQLRTRWQDLWANAVEEHSRLRGVDLKSGAGPKRLREAYRAISEQFAEAEASGRVARLDLPSEFLVALTELIHDPDRLADIVKERRRNR